MFQHRDELKAQHRADADDDRSIDILQRGLNDLHVGGDGEGGSYCEVIKNLAALLVTFNLLAFACHTICDIAEQFWRLAKRSLLV